MPKILFVCHGNICRSPMAEYIMKDLTKDVGDFYIASAGTSNEEEGNDIYPPVKRVLEKHHIPYSHHSARILSESDYNNFDYIIIMDTYNERNIKSIISNDKQNKIKKLLYYVGTNNDVSDPWYTNEFEKCYHDIYQGCVGLFNYIMDGKDKSNELLNNIDKLHTTPLGMIRIKRNLSIVTDDVVDYLKTIIKGDKTTIYKNGKNWYCKKQVDNTLIIITVNSYNYCIITAHIKKEK